MALRVHEAFGLNSQEQQLSPLRVCRKCGVEALTDNDLKLFKKAQKLPHGRETICKECYRISQRVPTKPYLRKCKFCGLEAHSREDLESFRKDTRMSYGRANICNSCFKEEIRTPYYVTHRGEHKMSMTHRKQEIRFNVMQKLGGKIPRCIVCGTSDMRVLTVVHIHNNGAEERRKMSTEKIYLKIINDLSEDDARKDYQILCRNCNWIKHIEESSKEYGC